jgi:hypothetical protein
VLCSSHCGRAKTAEQPEKTGPYVGTGAGEDRITNRMSPVRVQVLQNKVPIYRAYMAGRGFVLITDWIAALADV